MTLSSFFSNEKNQYYQTSTAGLLDSVIHHNAPFPFFSAQKSGRLTAKLTAVLPALPTIQLYSIIKPTTDECMRASIRSEWGSSTNVERTDVNWRPVSILDRVPGSFYKRAHTSSCASFLQSLNL